MSETRIIEIIIFIILAYIAITAEKRKKKRILHKNMKKYINTFNKAEQLMKSAENIIQGEKQNFNDFHFSWQYKEIKNMATQMQTKMAVLIDDMQLKVKMAKDKWAINIMTDELKRHVFDIKRLLEMSEDLEKIAKYYKRTHDKTSAYQYESFQKVVEEEYYKRYGDKYSFGNRYQQHYQQSNNNQNYNKHYNNYQQQYKNNYQKQNYNQKSKNPTDEMVDKFFKDCTNLAQLKKCYKKLCMVYHPDQPTGDATIFTAINERYQQLQKKLS